MVKGSAPKISSKDPLTFGSNFITWFLYYHVGNSLRINTQGSHNVIKLNIKNANDVHANLFPHMNCGVYI